jgi:hypothetical protein
MLGKLPLKIFLNVGGVAHPRESPARLEHWPVRMLTVSSSRSHGVSLSTSVGGASSFAPAALAHISNDAATTILKKGISDHNYRLTKNDKAPLSALGGRLFP